MPDDYKEWNLIIIWQPEPGDDSSTTMTIAWDSSKLAESEYGSVVLHKDNTDVSDLLYNCLIHFVINPRMKF